MDAQELFNLQEAYMEVYASQKELLNERLRRFPGDKVWAKQEEIQDRLLNQKLSRKERQKLSRRWSDMDDVRQDMQNPRLPISQHTPQGSRVKSLANKNRPESEKRSKTVKQPIRTFPNRLMRGDRQGIHDSYDLYDIILLHLLDEGYAETPEAAEVIMVNMSEDWRESIVEAIEGLRPASERMARGVLTSSQREAQRARARREEKKKEELEKAANAILNQLGGASRRSSVPMGSTQAPQKAEAPEANRRIKPKVKSDELASAADKVLRSLR